MGLAFWPSAPWALGAPCRKNRFKSSACLCLSLLSFFPPSGVSSQFSVAGRLLPPLSVARQAMRFLNRISNGGDEGHLVTRMSWPEASMTWGDRMRFAQGEIHHRDATFSIAPSEGTTLWRPAVPRLPGRQDAPAGSGSLLMHSPKGLDTLRASRRNAFPNPEEMLQTVGGSSSPRWEPMRATTAAFGGNPTAAFTSPRLATEPWQNQVRTTFPRVTGYLQHPKAELHASRAAARWQERLKERAETPRY